VPSKSKPRRTRTLRIESLESRTVPTTATYSGGVLSVFGTSAAETITVQESPAGRLSVTNKVGAGPATPVIIQYGSLRYTSIGVGAASKLYVDGGAGDDVIDASTVPTALIQLFGGAGNDSLIGG
jgi:hypothetical protein